MLWHRGHRLQFIIVFHCTDGYNIMFVQLCFDERQRALGRTRATTACTGPGDRIQWGTSGIQWNEFTSCHLILGIHRTGCCSFLSVCEPTTQLKSSNESWLMTFPVNGIESAVELKKSQSTLHGTPELKLSDSIVPKFNISSRGRTNSVDFSPWKWTRHCLIPEMASAAYRSRLCHPFFSLSFDLLLLATQRPADLSQWQVSSLSRPPWATGGAHVAWKTRRRKRASQCYQPRHTSLSFVLLSRHWLLHVAWKELVCCLENLKARLSGIYTDWSFGNKCQSWERFKIQTTTLSPSLSQTSSLPTPQEFCCFLFCFFVFCFYSRTHQELVFLYLFGL